MRVLVVGGGGREHALVWKLSQSALVDELIAAPGNAGIASIARCQPVRAEDVPGVVELVERERIDLTVVGPEAPLVAGLADELAVGKGVTVATDRGLAADALRDALVAGAFGDAGATVVVEEVLEGPEVSAFVLADGRTVTPLALSQDAKRAGDGDTGPNTGGMGAYAPLPWVDATTEAGIWDMMHRSVSAMAAEGVVYRGLLYGGFMLTADGPKVLEFNCRFGDPETEAVLPTLRGDLAELLSACAEGRLEDAKVDRSEDAAVTVVLASGGYPGPYETGMEIHGLPEAGALDGVFVFHAGTAERDGRVVTAGGRVLAVSALGSSLAEARARAYGACERIAFEGMHHRHDIAARAAEGALG